ncbi:uncharacterized protein BCR38DRAFT_423372 [Pseudomassariella vexata]|uniref:Erythromycin biosynthesis protein CIII-like C-terminal domain-containing protein n=1 Tax=Pseudomassariella vexata TaxID=1141098 RepID=A0A1Y2EA77_9PEZI|nr:uncharacterized protein BCR38DRAFT_423372 [Pseudomassariella vexata]ORY68473.1 hypothetical protein BCR38DRAFT_423372 [Pseudomassariella vexata]
MTINHDQETQNGQKSTVSSLVNGRKKSPLLVMTAAPATGHTAPAVHVAREMVKRGFEVIFMSALEFKDSIIKVGAEFYEMSSLWPEGTLEEREKFPVGFPRLVFDLEKIFTDRLPSRSANLRSLLEMVKQRDPSRQIIMVAETCSMAVLPFMYGAPLPKGYTKFPKVININVIPLPVGSIDTGPFGPGLPPDSTESGRARNKLIAQLMEQGPFKGAIEHHKHVLDSLGCKDLTAGHMFDKWVESYDTTFQLCSPSLEYPRSDLHPSIRFAGALPKKGIDPTYPYPAWWSIITSNSALPPNSADRKKVIPIAQGTIATDYTELIIPAINALSPRQDVLLIAMLGIRGASLPPDFVIPENTFVVDYLPYDAALEHANVFVTNGGYGSLMHGVNNGVPMVMAGVTEDKAEVSARAEWAGLAVNLRTQRPTEASIGEAVGRVLRDSGFKERTERVRRENRDLDCLGIIEREVWAFAKG